MFRVFIGAPSKEDLSKDPTSFHWHNVSSTSSASHAIESQPFPPATLEAASKRISQFYSNIIFNDDEEPVSDRSLEENSAAITWDESLVTEEGNTDPPIGNTNTLLISHEDPFASQEETQDTSAYYSDTSSIGRFPSFTFNLHVLVTISDLTKVAAYTKVNVLAAVLELDGPDVIHIKKGPDAGKEVYVLKMVLGDGGSVCRLTVWRETAEAWAAGGTSSIKRGDVVHFENLSVSKDPSTSATSSTSLTASPNLKSRHQICFRTMPATQDDLLLRPDLRLGYSDVAVRKVAAVVGWLEAMAGLKGH